MKYDGKIIKQVGDDIVVLSHFYQHSHVSLAEVMECIIEGDREYKPRYETVTVDESSIRRKEGDYVKWVFRPNEHQDMEIEPFLDCRYFWRDGHKYTLSFVPGWYSVGDCLDSVFGILWNEEARLVCHNSGEMEYDTIYETVMPVGYGKTWLRMLSFQDVVLNGPDYYNEIRNLGEVWETFTKPRRGDPKVKTHDDAMLAFLRNYSEHIANKRFLAEYKKQHNAQ